MLQLQRNQQIKGRKGGGSRDHLKKDCPKREPICYGCRKPGHFKRDCPEAKKGKGTVSVASQDSSSGARCLCASSTPVNDLPRIYVDVQQEHTTDWKRVKASSIPKDGPRTNPTFDPKSRTVHRTVYGTVRPLPYMASHANRQENRGSRGSMPK